jgi:DNA-binding Lrp family transcriptional regulator
MDKIKLLTKLDEIKIFSVPYRMKILDYMYSFKAPATVKNIADKMGETPAKIHYHIKKMETMGIVRLVHTENVNGIIAKFYEPAAENFDIRHITGQDQDKMKILNETQKSIAAAFEESKRNFIEQLEKVDKKHNGYVTAEKIYLSEVEFENMRRELENIYNKYSSDLNTEGKSRYNTFFTIIDSE